MIIRSDKSAQLLVTQPDHAVLARGPAVWAYAHPRLLHALKGLIPAADASDVKGRVP